MKGVRKTCTLSVKMGDAVAEWARKWGVTESEAMRRLFGMGDLLAEAFDRGEEIRSMSPETGESRKWVFPIR